MKKVILLTIVSVVLAGSIVSSDLGSNLLEASRTGDIIKAQNALARFADVNVSSNGVTPLMYASKQGSVEMVELLLAAGANVDAEDFSSLGTALSWAVEGGRVGVIKLLLDAGADVNHADVHGETALIRAREKGFEEVVGILLAAEANPR